MVHPDTLQVHRLVLPEWMIVILHDGLDGFNNIPTDTATRRELFPDGYDEDDVLSGLTGLPLMQYRIYQELILGSSQGMLEIADEETLQILVDLYEN